MSGSRAKALRPFAKRNAKGEMDKNHYRRVKRSWSSTKSMKDIISGTV